MPHYFADFLHSSCQNIIQGRFLSFTFSFCFCRAFFFLSWLYLPPLWPLFPLLNVLAQLSLPLLFTFGFFFRKLGFFFTFNTLLFCLCCCGFFRHAFLLSFFAASSFTLRSASAFAARSFLRELSAQQLSALVLSAHATFPLHEPLWLL